MNYLFSGKLWGYLGDKANWHFVSVPKEISLEIRNKYKNQSRGFGSHRVNVKIGESTWQTSIFPDKISEQFFLPIKAKVRMKEQFYTGDIKQISLEII